MDSLLSQANYYLRGADAKPRPNYAGTDLQTLESAIEKLESISDMYEDAVNLYKQIIEILNDASKDE